MKENISFSFTKIFHLLKYFIFKKLNQHIGKKIENNLYISKEFYDFLLLKYRKHELF